MSCSRHIVSVQNTNTYGEKHDGNIHVQPVDNRAGNMGMFHSLYRVVLDESKTFRSADTRRSQTALGNPPTEREMRQQKMETDHARRPNNRVRMRLWAQAPAKTPDGGQFANLSFRKDDHT